MNGAAIAELKQRISKLSELPTLPQVVQTVVAKIAQPSTSAEDLARVLERDQVLAAKVLRLANSPFYGFPSRIASVDHAVVVLGLNVVKGLTLCASALDIIQEAGMHQLWRHSLGVAMTSQIIARRLGLKNPEDVFVAGLLHDLGKVVLYLKAPEIWNQVEALSKANRTYMLDTEQTILDFTHAEVAGWLADAWHLPVVLREPMLFHHQPAAAQTARVQTAIVHVADLLVKAMGCGQSGDDLVPALAPEAWALVNLPDEVLAECIEQAFMEFDTIDELL
jgi:HD-like signal output (HDOD) protein